MGYRLKMVVSGIAECQDWPAHCVSSRLVLSDSIDYAIIAIVNLLSW